MVEGDLVDLTVPTLLHALASEGSTAVLKVQRGTSQGELFFREGTLVHALAGGRAGDDAVRDLMHWHEGRFRLVRDADRQPHTVTQAVADFLRDRALPHDGDPSASAAGGDPDRQLLDALVALLARVDPDRARLTEGRLEPGGVPALLVLASLVNTVITFVKGRCGDPTVLPSRVLLRMADTQPYTQLLGEQDEEISISTAISVLDALDSVTGDRRRLFHDLAYALLDVMVIYGDTISTFFHAAPLRDEWRAMFDVFIEGLWTAVQQVDV
jgi:Domain of unknown function (DUF4388)